VVGGGSVGGGVTGGVVEPEGPVPHATENRTAKTKRNMDSLVRTGTELLIKKEKVKLRKELLDS
jgi:cytochrome c